VRTACPLIRPLWIILCFWGGGEARAEFSPQEPLLYPAGFPTADELRPGEWLLAPPPWGWVAVGLPGETTLALDYPAALFGVPGALVRVGLSRGRSAWQVALEGYGAYFVHTRDDNRTGVYLLQHHGVQSWLHINASATLTDRVRIHAYAGANYAYFERYAPWGTGPDFGESVFHNGVTPMGGVDVEVRANSWLMVHLNALYGNSFVYVDQVARKQMAVLSLLAAPFPKDWIGVLSRSRIELAAFWVRVPDAHYRALLPLPLYPSLYWQFGV